VVLDPNKETRRLDAPATDTGVSLSHDARRELATVEFWVFALAVAAVLIAAAVADPGQPGEADPFGAYDAWRLVAFLTVGYLVSRGLARIGRRDAHAGFDGAA
jgi:hypothetical protein